MRIGILTTYLALGDDNDSGIGQHYRILADALAAQGHRVHVVYATLERDRALAALASLRPLWSCDVVTIRPSRRLERIFQHSWPTQVLLARLPLLRAAGRKLAEADRELRLEIVETHSFHTPALFFSLSRHRPKIVTRVSTTQGQMNAISPTHSRVLRAEARLERWHIRRAEALLTHTRQHRDAICAAEGYDPARFALVPHGLPDPGEPSAVSAPASSADAVEFLYVGRFESRKGTDVLLAAIPEVAAAFPRAVFTLAGSRGDGVDWQTFATRHPELAGSRVRSLGRVSAATLAELYRRCDILVAPSRYESFGLIYAEGMSYGKPVIGCRAGGVPEVVENGLTGLLTEPGDVASLAAAMKQLAGDADLRHRMGAAGRRDFVARFSAAELARASVDCYRRVLAS